MVNHVNVKKKNTMWISLVKTIVKPGMIIIFILIPYIGYNFAGTPNFYNKVV